MENIYQFSVKNAAGEDVSLEDFKGKNIIVVNVASKCGFTPQYEELQKIYSEGKDQGLVILGFPCNQFGSQEPGTDADIQSFCSMNYGVEFPVFGKIEVNGDNTHPLYKYLKSELPGILGSQKVKWNFTKFWIGSDGTPRKRFAPTDSPEKIWEEIKRSL